MCLVLEADEPLFLFAVNFNRNDDAAGIYLIGFLHVSQLTGFEHLLHGKGCHVHKA